MFALYRKKGLFGGSTLHLYPNEYVENGPRVSLDDLSKVEQYEEMQSEVIERFGLSVGD